MSSNVWERVKLWAVGVSVVTTCLCWTEAYIILRQMQQLHDYEVRSARESQMLDDAEMLLGSCLVDQMLGGKPRDKEGADPPPP